MTEPQDFDPYSQRLARDVRNTLGHSFVHGLMHDTPDPAHYALDQLKPNDLPQAHQRWIDSKVEQYRRFVRDFGSAKSNVPPLILGLDLWRAGLFFEAHEAIEEAWQSATGDRRLALKALVQAIGACIHARRGAAGPAASLAAKAAANLEQYGHSLAEVPWLTQLVARLRQPEPLEICNKPWFGD